MDPLIEEAAALLRDKRKAVNECQACDEIIRGAKARRDKAAERSQAAGMRLLEIMRQLDVVQAGNTGWDVRSLNFLMSLQQPTLLKEITN